MVFLQKALTGLLAASVAADGLVARNWGQSIPDCGGLARFEKVLSHMGSTEGLYRSSAPFYDSFEDDDEVHLEDKHEVTQETIDCLHRYGITHVISLNHLAYDSDVMTALRQGGIVYTPLAVLDFHAPSLAQVEEAWNAFRRHRSSTLVWCGYGHGRTGTMISALQMYVQSEREEPLYWTREHYEQNEVERDVQFELLDHLQQHLRHDTENQPETPMLVDIDEATLERVRLGSFEGVDCPAVLHLALAMSLLSIHDKRWVFFEGGECARAQELLLRERCAVNEYSRPSAAYLEPQGIRVVSINSQGQLIETGYSSGDWWYRWTNRGGHIASEPAIVFRAEDNFRVYARSTSNTLLESGYYNGHWHLWTDLGGDIRGAPTAIWLGDDLGMRVYARGNKNQLKELTFSGDSWKGWRDLGGHFVDDPSAIYLEHSKDIRIYARNRRGQLLEKAWEAYAWQKWKNLGGSIRSSPSAVYLGPGNIRVYARNKENELMEKRTWGGTWQPDWVNLGETPGGAFTGSPGAVSLGVHGIRIYARNAVGDLVEKQWWDDAWHEWKNLGHNMCQG
ncbi:hypothetical protein ED733_001812 [Metarhizium rileyi]|uniref:Fucose-specific lectin n=1 Tax=Metarhizium rileyi (strain RCEF 4871) TaxID=1649241 RepID=A0A5C6G1U7_METRR|nr:hypothetical protein ED733_001812 [Metarhizium rileyi]